MSIPLVVLCMRERIGVLSCTAPARRPQGEKTLDPIWERKPLGLTMAPVRSPCKVVPAAAQRREGAEKRSPHLAARQSAAASRLVPKPAAKEGLELVH